MADPTARVVTFWMDNGLVADIDQRAAENGQTRSGFVKDVLRRECETPPPEH